MAVIACGTVILIALHALMVVIGRSSIVFVTKDAFELREIRRILVAIGACVPFIPMVAGVNGEVESVMIKVSRRPRNLRMASNAVGRETCRLMVRVSGLVEIGLVASDASIRSSGVDAAGVALRTTEGRMSTRDNIILFVDGKRSGCPTWVGGVALIACQRKCERFMVGVRGCIVIGSMAAAAYVRSVRIISVVTTETLPSNICMRTGECIIGIVYCKRCGLPIGVGRVAGLALG